ncbi:hypothetical protein HDV03_001657 [Kappamyces sp. JEL0829]|nr:hypothetical protein HDV03_001657 [Kappamyces sp. JEL0829]KAJ3365564.1 hypothetical protein HDU91_002163 [Kappamyces sp. JEL0680]
MDGDELAAIRAKRMAELRAQQGGGASQGPAMGMAGLAQILSPEARERLARIRIVKEEKARGVEEMLIRMAQSGQIRGKVSETQLIDILSQVNESVSAPSKIKITRRAAEVDSDEELLAGL